MRKSDNKAFVFYQFVQLTLFLLCSIHVHLFSRCLTKVNDIPRAPTLRYIL